MNYPKLDARPSPYHPAHHTIYSLANLDDNAYQQSIPRTWSWFLPFGLNQGREGACVGHGITEELYNKPDAIKFSKLTLPDWAVQTREMNGHGTMYEPALAQAYAFDSYHQFRREDEWAGEGYDGTSLNAGARVTMALGLWRGFRWAENALQLRKWLRFGNVVAATPWFTSMFEANSQGWLEPKGIVEGWHCYLLNRNSEKRGGLWTPNSWGGGGQGWIAWETINGMIQDHQAEYLIPLYRDVKVR